MLARITSLHFHPERVEEAFTIVMESVLPSIKDQRGCQGVLVLRGPNGDAVTLTLWMTEADMAAAASGNYPTQIARLDGMLRDAPARNTYQVAELALSAHVATGELGV